MMIRKLIFAIKAIFRNWKLHKAYGASRRTGIKECIRHFKKDMGWKP